MKRRNITFAILAVLALFLLFSCSSAKVYPPLTVDFTEQTQLLFEQRPDNSTLTVIEEPKSTWDYLYNGETYFFAWNAWQSYAEALESYILETINALK